MHPATDSARAAGTSRQLSGTADMASDSASNMHLLSVTNRQLSGTSGTVYCPSIAANAMYPISSKAVAMPYSQGTGDCMQAIYEGPVAAVTPRHPSVLDNRPPRKYWLPLEKVDG